MFALVKSSKHLSTPRVRRRRKTRQRHTTTIKTDHHHHLSLFQRWWYQKHRCGHCKALKPAWDKLGDEYDGSSTVLIGDVDCTVHQNLCQKYGVQGYPTLKYFTANPMGDSYNGGRDYEELSKFAKESLGPSCGVEHMELCDAEQKKSLEAKMALSDAELDKLIEDSDAKLKQADDDLEALLKGLQQQYEDGKKAKEDAQAAISPELAQLRSVKRSRDKKAKQEL